MCGTGRQPFGVDAVFGVAIPRKEPEKAQDPQIVFPDPPPGVLDEADMPRPKVRQPAQRVRNRAVRRAIKRVHREIAATCVLGQSVGEGDDCPPAVRSHIAAERRHFERRRINDQGDRAVVDPRGQRPDPRGIGQCQNLLGPCIGRDVEIGDRRAKQRISYATAHEPRLMARIGQ